MSSRNLHLTKTQHFQIFHAKLHMHMDALDILWSFGPPESQKTCKIWLSATFLNCRKLPWENWVLTRKMNSKSRYSSWVGKQTHRPFQQAYACPIWPPKSAPNMAPKARDMSGICARHVGQFSQEIHLQLRNSPSFDQFWLEMGFFTLFDVINVFSCYHDTHLPILEDSCMK